MGESIIVSGRAKLTLIRDHRGRVRLKIESLPCEVTTPDKLPNPSLVDESR